MSRGCGSRFTNWFQDVSLSIADQTRGKGIDGWARTQRFTRSRRVGVPVDVRARKICLLLPGAFCVKPVFKISGSGFLVRPIHHTARHTREICGFVESKQVEASKVGIQCVE